MINRILIIGSPGSGKTTFSKQLSEVLNIPVFHLDDYYWLPNWKRINKEQWNLVLNDLCTQRTWIIEGNHFNSFEQRLRHADLVILLNCSVLLCFWSFCKRSIQRFFLKDKSLPINIRNDKSYKPQISIQWHIIKLILFFKIETKPKMLALSSQYSLKLIQLSTRRSMRYFLASPQELLEQVNVASSY